MNIETVEATELEGKTREQLLEMCRARGLAATAWRRERMHAVLTGAEEAPAPKPRAKADGGGNALAAQLEQRRLEKGQQDQEAARARREHLAKRTGRCLSKNGCQCEAYEPGKKDAFGWQMCECQHTDWSHAVVEPA